ncbi:MAG: amidohydrolase family protein, partial [Acidobacteriota bacterium]
MTTRKLLALAASLLLAAPAAIAQQEEGHREHLITEVGWETAPAGPWLVRNATIWTQDEAGILEGADVLVRDGKIAAIGSGLEAGDAEVIDASGMHVTPGIIDAHSHSGTDSTINEGSDNITAEVRIEDTLNAEQGNVYQQLAGGTTAAQILHGSANSIGGQSAIVKWRYRATRDKDMLIEDVPPTIKFALGENPKRSAFGSLPIPGFDPRYPTTRMGVANSIRRAFIRARDYQRRWREYEALSEAERARTAPPRRDLQAETLVEILEGERLVHSHSYRQDEIIRLIRIAEEMGFRIGAFQHVLEGYKASHEIAAHGAGASTFSDWWAYKMEVYDAIPYNGAIMHNDGVVVSFNSDSGELARHLNLEAAKAVKYGGLSEQDALAFVTSNPARQLRLFDRTGSLAEGKDADLVVWNGHPLSVYSRVEMTFVDGRRMFDREQDLRLRQAREEEKRALVAMIRGDDGDNGEDAEEEGDSGTEGDAEDAEEETAAAGGFTNAGVIARDYVPDPLGQEGITAIVGATVHTVSGGSIDNGVVVFEDGVITAVGGPDTEVPADATRVDASGRHLWPGMISMDSTIGLVEISSVPGSVDTAETGEFNPELRAEVAVNAASEHIPVTRANGVTHTLTIPRGGTFTGQSALLRMDGWSWEEMTAVSRAGLHMDFPGGGGGGFFFGPQPSEEELRRQREEGLKRVDEMLDAARAYARARSATEEVGVHHEQDVKLDALADLLAGEMPLFIHTSGARSIRAALEWLGEQPEDLRVIVLDSGDTWRAADELAAAGVPVVVSSVLTLPTQPDDPYDAAYFNATR